MAGKQGALSEHCNETDQLPPSQCMLESGNLKDICHYGIIFNIQDWTPFLLQQQPGFLQPKNPMHLEHVSANFQFVLEDVPNSTRFNPISLCPKLEPSYPF
jgi:hypothetical protein